MRQGRIWEIYSESGIGKTELFHTLAINFVCQHEQQREVLYLDTKREFNSERIEEILKQRQVDMETMQICLNAIKVVGVISAQSLIAALEDFCMRLSSGDATVSGIKLILIDSLAASFILFRSGYERNAGRSFLTRLAMLMRQLATAHGLSFVLANLIMPQNADSECERILYNNEYIIIIYLHFNFYLYVTIRQAMTTRLVLSMTSKKR